MYIVRVPGLAVIEQTTIATHAHSAFESCEVAGTQLCRLDDLGQIRVIETKKHKGFTSLSVEERNNLHPRAVELGVRVK